MLSQQARMKQAFSHTCFLMPKGKLAACQFNLMSVSYTHLTLPTIA